MSLHYRFGKQKNLIRIIVRSAEYRYFILWKTLNSLTISLGSVQFQPLSVKVENPSNRYEAGGSREFY